MPWVSFSPVPLRPLHVPSGWSRGELPVALVRLSLAGASRVGRERRAPALCCVLLPTRELTARDVSSALGGPLMNLSQRFW